MRINKSLITYIPSSGAGSGSVTSVALSAPTGFTVSGSPITSSGTLSLAFASGYSLPTNIKQGQWDDAYTWVSNFPTITGNDYKFLSNDGTSLLWLAAMTNPMTTEGDLIYQGAVVPQRLPANSSGNNMFLRSVSSGVPSWATITGTDITGAALTRTNDTNVQITLGGTPTTALLRSVSLTMGWTGQLSVPRGGTGASTLTGVVIGNSTGAMTAVVGTANQILRRNAGDTAYEFYTPTFLSNPMTSLGDMITGNAAGAPLRLPGNTTTTRKYLSQIGDGTNVLTTSWETVTGGVSGSGTTDYVSKWTSSTALGNSIIRDNGTNVGIGISPSHKLDIGGNIGISGKIILAASGVNHVIYDQSVNPFLIIGDSSTGITTYNQTIHTFRNRGGTTTYASMSSTLFDVKMTISAGNQSATDGSIMLQDNYTIGHLGNIGTMYSGGNLMLGYGVTPSTLSATGFISATGLTISRSAITVGSSIVFYTGSSQSVSIGSSVSLNENMSLKNTGQFKLNSYTSSTSFAGTAAGYLAFTSVGDIITVAAPTGTAGQYRIDFNSTTPETWSNQPSTLQFFDAQASFITAADLTNFTEVRFLINKLGTAAATGAKMYLRYSTTYSQTASSYSDIGTSSVELAIDTSNQFLETSWINLASGAKADVFVTILGDGGDGVLDPIFGMISAEFR